MQQPPSVNVPTGSQQSMNRRHSPPTNNNPINQQLPLMDPNQKHYKIAELKPLMTDFSITCIVLEKQNTIKTKDNQHITYFLVADDTAFITLTLWNHKADYIMGGDIIRIIGAQTQLWQKSCINLTTSRNATISRVGDYCMVFNETKNMSTIEWEESPPGSKKYVQVKLKQTPQVSNQQ